MVWPLASVHHHEDSIAEIYEKKMSDPSAALLTSSVTDRMSWEAESDRKPAVHWEETDSREIIHHA